MSAANALEKFAKTVDLLVEKGVIKLPIEEDQGLREDPHKIP